MVTLKIVLMIAALLLEIFAALGVPSPRLNLIAAGLACWLAALILAP
jgi:hypothetical protein